MPVKYNNESLCEFHEVHHRKQSSSVAQPSKHYDISNKIVKESALESQVHSRLTPKQSRITAWSSSSSLSSLTTDSLFSLPDSPSATMKYKTTGILFDNLDLVPFDPQIDPEPYACFNCWHLDHKYQNCPNIRINNYCRNCGRKGVAIKECPRCARAYMDYLDQSYNKHCEVFVSRMEVEKPIDDVELNVVEERYHESWDDVVECDQKSPQVSFSDSWQRKETEYEDDDWDSYQSPRTDSIKKSSKLYSLNATKAEVAKYKDDNWSDSEVVNYSYSWGEYSYKTRGRSSIDPEEGANKVEDWNYFEQDDVKEFSQNQFNSSTTLENKRTEYHDEEAYKDCSIANSKTRNLIVNSEAKVVDEIVSESKSNESSHEMDQNNWSDEIEKVSKKSGQSFILEIKDQNLNISQNQDDKEDWSDSEAYQSFQVSFCEESETGNYPTALNSIADEEYWTDFDDDYESLQASFAEEYKSLDNTMEDENDVANTCTNELFSFVENEKVDDLFVPKQNGYQANSLTSSVGSQSDEPYLSNAEDLDDYEYMIVDENERSESLPFAGQAVQEFLHLLDTLKHLPIQTQNIAVLHFISKQREEAWQNQMQKRT